VISSNVANDTVGRIDRFMICQRWTDIKSVILSGASRGLISETRLPVTPLESKAHAELHAPGGLGRE